jgi:hypothetical protein
MSTQNAKKGIEGLGTLDPYSRLQAIILGELLTCVGKNGQNGYSPERIVL